MDYDVAIIGGGIHGVGVAQATAARGYKTVLLEQYDHLAEGTSSRSSKLIHGGLRYLEQYEFSLVRECLLERSYLLKNAPDLVKLTPVYIPVYKSSKRSPLMIRAGLSLYALLGNFSADARFKKVKKSQWNQLHGLNQEKLRAVYQYYEAQTDDALLTQAVMASAQQHGAELILNAKVTNIKINDDQSQLSYVNDLGQEVVLTSKVIVNAAGPWAASVVDCVQPKQKNVQVDLVQGTHIVLPIQLGEVIFYIESPKDKRPIFIMPWYGETMIGTTESIFEDDPSKTYPLEKEVDYLLDAFYCYFPEQKNKDLMVSKQYSGLRVLPRSQKNANQRSRETIYLRDRINKPRLLSIFGGKLTAYRATAEHVLARIESSLPSASNHIDTKDLKLVRPGE
ncbi:MAG: glycerol-3-phosphate dehydrogenase/oxidase [Gammaproteobacteria bacterium]|nr:glycerol-3-phosphate dehydrogenase/oxidase [Gammaproteobacteria bacterium]